MTSGERTVRHDVLERVREIENVWIPMPDGCRLAARVWMPVDAEDEPVPAILEYIPYRKRDFMRARDEPIHRYFAGHGYAAVRVDVRGTGDSEGVLTDEYTEQEHDDAVAIIAWLAAQPWCTGAVGMIGISWGGINALQVAARRPPELGAVITLCSTDDRYTDDAHYMGGCLLNENFQWGAILMLYNALPPDPEIAGERWREMWLERLDGAVPFPAEWARHPSRNGYWKHGSVIENYDAIRCPVYAIGGWADGYSNAVGRLLAGLSCPRKGLIGPWAHTFPHNGRPGPAIGFLQEAVRWWDHWLGGRETGIMDEPMLRAWMQDSVRPAPQYEERPGRWVAEEEWPSPHLERRAWFLEPGRLTLEAAPTVVDMSFASPQITGLVSGEWCAFGADGEMPLDQRPDDGRSLVFDSAPLDECLEILGAPVVEIELSADVEVAMIAVRLNDVARDGASTRVSYGLLNLTHRDGSETPRPLVFGQSTPVRVRLNDIAHAFPPGHRIRVAISTCYWPIAWPAPQPATLTVHGGGCLQLPVRAPRPEDDDLPPFEPPEVAPGSAHTLTRPLPFKRVVERDLATGAVVYTLSSDGGEFGGHARAHLEDIDLELGYTLVKRHRIAPTDPLTACTELTQQVRMRRGEWSVCIDGVVRVEAAPETLRFRAEIVARENDDVVRSLQWDEEIPRELF